MLNQAFAITPSDSEVQPAHEAIYVGGAGDLSITTRIPDGVGGWTNTTVTLVGLTAGRLLPIYATRINATGTTATALVGLR